MDTSEVASLGEHPVTVPPPLQFRSVVQRFAEKSAQYTHGKADQLMLEDCKEDEAYEDTSEVASLGEHPVPPLRGATKFKFIRPHAQPPLKGTTDSLLQNEVYTVKPQIIYVDPSQFRSVVQRLTGKSAQYTHGKADQLMLEDCKEDNAYEDMFKCMNSLKMLDYSVNVSQECLDCLVYCSLFPKDYEIDRDTLIQLWMAEGLIKEEPMEDVAASYLQALSENKEVISLLKEDYATAKIWYKMKGLEIPEQFLERSNITPVRLNSDDPASVLSSTDAEHFHVSLQRLLTKDLQAIGKFTKTRALLLLQNHKANVEHIPYDVFMSLQHLRALDLSRTKISELPSSIGNIRCLCYLNLSETLIKRLPETLEFLQNLQTLKVQNCPRLVALPKATKRLTSLRHLDFGTLRRIHSMPAGIGALTCLRTLSEFIVGREWGCRIGELENINELRGNLCLSRLEYVDGPDEAGKANLSNKHHLKKLELRWTDHIHQESIGVNHEVIFNLRPHTNLQDLRIISYTGSTFPSWITHPSFVKLTRITLFKCATCLFLPSLGQLPSLESLSLIELIEVRTINYQIRKENPINAAVGAANKDDQFVAFPMLQNLEIRSMLNLEKWSDIEILDFPCLKKLSIKDCPKLSALCKLTNMTSLEYLELNQCTKLPSLPEGELPGSLTTMVIEGCDSFNSAAFLCSIKKKQYWVKIQHSPSLLIYQREEQEKQERFLDPPEWSDS